MKTTNNTVLVTGGSAGIGFEIAKSLIEKGNQVIIIGRDQSRLDVAKKQLGNVTAIKADVSDAKDIAHLIDTIKTIFPDLNIVINNAGKASLYNLADENQNAVNHAEDEMLTNYLSVIRLNQGLLPLLKQQNEAAIVNVSSVVAYVPGANLPTYAASKAALHSYSISLRLTLEETSVKVFELMPPLVDTELSAAIGGKNGIPPSQVANEFLTALAHDEFEIRVGDTAKVYELFLSSPQNAIALMNEKRNEWTNSVK